MKFIATLIFSIIISSLLAQDLSTEKLYTKIIFEEISIKDKSGKIITESNLFDQLFSVDTSIHCFGEVEFKFKDLAYNSELLNINRWTQQIEFKEGSNENGYEIFKHNINPETGNLISKQHLFSFETKSIDKIEKASTPNDSNLINTKFDNWKIVSIENNSKSIEIDSCLLNYNLSLFDSNKLNQSYKSGLNCGKYIEASKDYFHGLTYFKGFWKTINDKLIIVNAEYEKIIIWKYEFKNNTLKLKQGKEYLITLRKESCK